MAHTKLYLFVLLLATAALPSFAFTLANDSNYRLSKPEDDEPETLFQAVVYSDGRPTEILVDRLGDPEDYKYQLGDPVSDVYPFIGAFGTLQKTAQGGIMYGIHCTSSLIDPKSVITAAHCVTPRQPGTYIFVHGLSDVRVLSYNDYKVKKNNFAEIDTLTYHPQYEREPDTIFDVAVATLSKPLDSSNSKTKPVCLGSTDQYNTEILGAGWGYKDCYQGSDETLRKAKSILVDQEECKRIHARTTRGKILDQNICTYFKSDNGEPAASASGDSGGPLFSYADPNKPVLIGTTSWSAKQGRDPPLKYCTVKTIPMVFARVSFFKDFINGLAPDAQWC